MQVPDAAKTSPDVSWLFGEATCFLQGAGSREQTAPVPRLQAIRGWGEQAEQHKVDSSSYPLPLNFSLPAGCRYQKGGCLGARRITSRFSKKPPGTWEEVPGEQHLPRKALFAPRESASPSSCSSGFKARMARNTVRCLQAADKLPKLLSGGQKHPCPAQSSRTSSLTCDAASHHHSASPCR